MNYNYLSVGSSGVVALVDCIDGDAAAEADCVCVGGHVVKIARK